MSKKQQLLNQEEQELLKQARKVKELSLHKGWLEVLKPLLEEKYSNSWVDPKDFDNQESFVYAYNVAHGWATAGKELLAHIQRECDVFDYLTKKSKGEVDAKDFRIGSKEIPSGGVKK